MTSSEIVSWVQAEEAAKNQALRRVDELEARVKELEADPAKNARNQAPPTVSDTDEVLMWRERATRYQALYCDLVRQQAEPVIQQLVRRWEVVPEQPAVHVAMEPIEQSFRLFMGVDALTWNWAPRANGELVQLQTTLPGLKRLAARDHSGVTVITGEGELKRLLLSQAWLWEDPKGPPAGP
jgi:hypothetical protein